MSGNNNSEIKRTQLLLDRLFSYRYETLIAEGEDLRQQGRKKLQEADKVARENDEKKRELDARERKLDYREDIINTKEEGTEKLSEKGTDPELVAAALEMLQNVRTDVRVERTITEDSLKRDDYIKEAVVALKQKALDMKYAIEQRNAIANDYGCGYDVANIRHIKAGLRAALISIVMFCRDSLPQVDGVTFNINGEPCANFLKKQIEMIGKESSGIIKTEYGVSEYEQKIMQDVYVSLADSLGYNAYGDNLDILHGEFGRVNEYGDYVGMCIARECYEPTGKCFKLVDKDGKTLDYNPRVTIDVSVPSELEVEINETAKAIDDWEK